MPCITFIVFYTVFRQFYNLPQQVCPKILAQLLGRTKPFNRWCNKGEYGNWHRKPCKHTVYTRHQIQILSSGLYLVPSFAYSGSAYSDEQPVNLYALLHSCSIFTFGSICSILLGILYLSVLLLLYIFCTCTRIFVLHLARGSQVCLYALTRCVSI